MRIQLNDKLCPEGGDVWECVHIDEVSDTAVMFRVRATGYGESRAISRGDDDWTLLERDGAEVYVEGAFYVLRGSAGSITKPVVARFVRGSFKWISKKEDIVSATPGGAAEAWTIGRLEIPPC